MESCLVIRRFQINFSFEEFKSTWVIGMTQREVWTIQYVLVSQR